MRRAAHAAALTALPSGLWRVALALGMPMGYAPRAARELFDVPGAGAAYMMGLSLLLEGLALLTLGLVKPSGERVPAWVPLAGERRLNPTAVALSAGTGSVALTLLWVPFAVLWWFTPGDAALDETARTAVGLVYLPLAAWGPLLGVVALSYHHRHRRALARRGGAEPHGRGSTLPTVVGRGLGTMS